jgi:hypothetical protein
MNTSHMFCNRVRRASQYVLSDEDKPWPVCILDVLAHIPRDRVRMSSPVQKRLFLELLTVHTLPKDIGLCSSSFENMNPAPLLTGTETRTLPSYI